NIGSGCELLSKMLRQSSEKETRRNTRIRNLGSTVDRWIQTPGTQRSEERTDFRKIQAEWSATRRWEHSTYKVRRNKKVLPAESSCRSGPRGNPGATQAIEPIAGASG